MRTDLLDDGENRALRSCLMQYGLPGLTVGAMRSHMERSGWEGCWPEFVSKSRGAMRAIERHGGAQILDRAFTGFTALPAPTARSTWRAVFGFFEDVPVTPDAVRRAYRRLASERHPDRAGGSDAAMSELNVALAEAEREIGS